MCWIAAAGRAYIVAIIEKIVKMSRKTKKGELRSPPLLNPVVTACRHYSG
jgi:hypothetical protein